MRFAKKSVETMASYGYVPDNVIMVGTGPGFEYRVFLEQWPHVKIFGIEANRASFEAAACFMDMTYAAVVDDATLIKTAFFIRHQKTLASSIYPRHPSLDRQIQVPAITLDAFAKSKKLTGKTFLYMDCEGSELNALRGGRALLETVDWIHSEVVENPGRLNWPKGSELRDFLKSVGFSIWDDYRVPRLVADILFRRDKTLIQHPLRTSFESYQVLPNFLVTIERLA
jgi:FkbM family methyltransferase